MQNKKQNEGPVYDRAKEVNQTGLNDGHHIRFPLRPVPAIANSKRDRLNVVLHQPTTVYG
jgi:hypothetical protein